MSAFSPGEFLLKGTECFWGGNRRVVSVGPEATVLNTKKRASRGK
jgi:hypothetical protein